jgi:carbon storage regulator CsrA
MLVLSRRLHEEIYLPSVRTVVQILAIEGGLVRLGIKAPPEVPIRRAELRDRAANGASPGRRRPAART